MNDSGRIPVCGMISRYNDTSLPEGPDTLPRLMRAILTRRLLVQGFIVTDHGARLSTFLSDMSDWLKSGKIRYREDITEGLENAVPAFPRFASRREYRQVSHPSITGAVDRSISD
ncbi:MAG: hypothetical protein CM1200mP39_24980 [Dehalococcoidia bacterium]|nr:MAG: hypothetical protein CM1200mP39_24980 [Dehalococcoidia bacterium]